MTPRLRDAGPQDRPCLTAFMAHLQDYEREIHPSRPPGEKVADDHLTYLEAECAAKQGRILVAVDEADIPVAFVILMVEDFGGHYLYPDHQKVGWVSDLWIEPAYRGGSLLDDFLSEAEQHFSQLGLKRMMLSHLCGNAGARKAYDKRGFHPYETILERDLP